MAGKRKKGCGEREKCREGVEKKEGRRDRGKSHKKMRQQKMAGKGGWGDRMDVTGVKQVKRQKRGEEKGLDGNGVKGAGGWEFNRQRE